MNSDDSITNEIAEIRTQIGRQLETKQHYENLSWQLIRLLLSIIGFLLTTVSILASIIISRGFSVFVVFGNAVDLESSVSSLTVIPFFDDFIAGYTIALLTFSVGVLFVLMVHDLFFKSLSYAIKIQRPSDLLTNLDMSSSDVDGDIHQEYRQKARDNAKVVQSTKDDWNNCLDYLERGSASFGLLLFIGPALVFRELFYVVIATIALGISATTYASNKSIIDNLDKVPIRKYSDVTTGITIVLITILLLYIAMTIERYRT